MRILATLALVLLLVACTAQTTPPLKTPPVQGQPSPSEPSKPSAPDLGASERVAHAFALASSTYAYDGNKLQLTSSTPSASGGVFTYEFWSANAGYGDRTGMVVATVLTKHSLVVTVANNAVTRAILDGAYDELTHEEVSAPAPEPTPTQQPPSGDELAEAREAVQTSPTYSYDGKGLALTSSDTTNLHWYKFSFTTAHPGLGDRTGQTLADTETAHTSVVVFREGTIIGIITDDTYNELFSRPLSSSRTNRKEGDTCGGPRRFDCGVGLSCATLSGVKDSEGICARDKTDIVCSLWKSETRGYACFRLGVTPASDYSAYTPAAGETVRCETSLQGTCSLRT